MRSFKLAKYNIKSNLKSIIIYYCILITFVTSITFLSGDGGNTSGIEFATMIFLFVLGLNSFKENFYFAQANNISRVDYFKSLSITILPIALGMSIIDVILNRIYNIFSVGPMIYDMGYGDFPSIYNILNKELWIQSNNVQIIIRTVTFLFAFYIAAFAIGLLITMIFNKSNKTMKILMFIIPIAIQVILANVAFNSPEFAKKTEVFFNNILGLNTKNSYMAVITFICLFIISMSFVYMLVSRAVVKRA